MLKGQLETLEPSEPSSELQSPGAPPRRVPASGSPEPLSKQEKPSARKLPTVERSERPSIRQTTGPRTPQGKARSKLNALKHGLLSKAVLLKDESRAEYASLLDGLRESLQPQGRLENELVENLAVLWWRKRRLLQAEKAEISKAEVLREEAPITLLVQRLNYVLPEGPLVGNPGSRSNLSVLREAMDCVEKHRLLAEANDEDLDQIRRIDFGPFPEEGPERERRARELREMAKLISAPPSREEHDTHTDQSKDQMRKRAIEGLEAEFDRLANLHRLQLKIEFFKTQSNFDAACIPSQDAMDRLLRYEAHLSREFDRTLNQLDRLQRMRKGQPVPPSLRLEVSS